MNHAMTPLVLHIRASNFFGGPERQIIGHILTSRNARHVVATFDENMPSNGFINICRQHGIPLEIIATKNSYDPSSIFKLRNVLETLQPGVICTHGYKPAILALAGRIGLNIPLIMFARGHTGENARVAFFENLEMQALRFADAIVAVSNGYADHLRMSGVPEKRLHVIQNAIDVDKFRSLTAVADRKREELGFHAGDLLIATAGRLSPEKAQGDLITAFSRIHSDFPNAHLLIMGDGVLRMQLESQLRERFIENVHFLGFRRDVAEIMAAIDLFVLPSLTEGLPNVVLEAFACAKPVVATSVGGVPDLVEDGISGFLAPPGNPAALADSITRCLCKSEKMQAMGEAGYLKVKSCFNVEAQTHKLEEIYREVLRS